MEKDRGAHLGNQQRLRDLCAAHPRDLTVFCAHDPAEYEALSGRRLGTPASPADPVPAAFRPSLSH